MTCQTSTLRFPFQISSLPRTLTISWYLSHNSRSGMTKSCLQANHPCLSISETLQTRSPNQSSGLHASDFFACGRIVHTFLEDADCRAIRRPQLTCSDPVLSTQVYASRSPSPLDAAACRSKVSFERQKFGWALAPYRRKRIQVCEADLDGLQCQFPV